MRSLVVFVFVVLGFVCSAQAGQYNYISTEDLKTRIEAKENLIIVDIQQENEFKQHHLPGSVATYAYPVKSDKERAQIDKAVEMYQKTGQDVVIVCPRGKGGAKRCYDYMQQNNVPTDKLFILEKGMAGWSYPELTEKG